MVAVGLEIIEAPPHVRGDGPYDRAVVRVGTVVHGHPHFAGEQYAVRVRRHADGVVLLRAEGGEHELLLAVVVKLHRATKLFCRDDGEKINIELARRFAAETAANKVGDHSDLRFGDVKEFRKILVAQARALR